MSPVTLRSLIEQLHRCGGRVLLDGDRLVLQPASRVPASLRDALRQRKSELREHLGGGCGVVQPPAPTLLEAKRPRWPCRGCGSAAYWAAKGGTAWICNGCHPTDLMPDQVDWHVVEDPRRVIAVTRSKVGCPACKLSGFVFLADGRWTVCRCNDGFERHVESEQEERDA